MSEDCHDSNNAPPVPFPYHIAIPCAECGEAVLPNEAYPCEFERLDGTTEIVVFHSSIDKLCPLKHAAKQLMTINDKLEAILRLMREVEGPMPVLVYDMKLKRPGCALLQAALGGSPGIAGSFPTEHWLLAPTEDLKPYKISTQELADVIQYHRKLVTK